MGDENVKTVLTGQSENDPYDGDVENATEDNIKNANYDIKYDSYKFLSYLCAGSNVVIFMVVGILFFHSETDDTKSISETIEVSRIVSKNATSLLHVRDRYCHSESHHHILNEEDCYQICSTSPECQAITWSSHAKCTMFAELKLQDCQYSKGTELYVKETGHEYVTDANVFVDKEYCDAAFSGRNERFNEMFAMTGSMCSINPVAECDRVWDAREYIGFVTNDVRILGTHNSMAEYCHRDDINVFTQNADCMLSNFKKLGIIDWNICKNIEFIMCSAINLPTTHNADTQTRKMIRCRRVATVMGWASGRIVHALQCI
jgi:hypothetical protein